MTPFTAYKKLQKAFPQYHFHVTTGANTDYFNATIYVTKDFNDLTNSFLQANSFDEKDPVGICFKEIMQKLTAEEESPFAEGQSVQPTNSRRVAQ